MARKLKSGIVGQAQVIFGGAIRMELGWVKSARGEELAIGMAELKHPAAKAGDPIIDEETYNGTQVTLVFPGFEPLNNFRYILDLLETELKKRIAERDAQQKIDFDDADPSHLVHEHIDPPTFEKAQGEQKPAENKGMNLVEKEMTPFQKKVFCIVDTTIEEEQGLSNICNELLALAVQEIEQKQEWSEDDEQYLLVCKNALAKYQTTDKWDANIIFHWLENKLKSLRGRVGCEANCTTMWKPSAEQMRALSDISITGCVSYAGQGQALTDLYNDLTKLKGE